MIVSMRFPTSFCMASRPRWQWQPAYPAGLPYDAAGPQLNWPHGSNAKKDRSAGSPHVPRWLVLGGAALWPSEGWLALPALLLCSPPSLCWKQGEKMNSASSEMIDLNWKCHQNAPGFISMRFLALCRNKRERESGRIFQKRGRERAGERLDRAF